MNNKSTEKQLKLTKEYKRYLDKLNTPAKQLLALAIALALLSLYYHAPSFQKPYSTIAMFSAMIFGLITSTWLVRFEYLREKNETGHTTSTNILKTIFLTIGFIPSITILMPGVIIFVLAFIAISILFKLDYKIRRLLLLIRFLKR